jgi:phosphatidylethanolamine/phosphatidyl-N-methylethanolamine N-methyltransferase
LNLSSFFARKCSHIKKRQYGMAVQYDLEGQKRIYERWAPFYDTVYNRLLSDAHRRTALAAAEAGPDILEVGVGTGLVLPWYPTGCRVTGVDLSQHMLKKAHEKAASLPHVSGIALMDACRLGFAEQRFDAVAFPFVLTLVPEPEQALNEALRVLKPGGRIVISSKLSDGKGLLGTIERKLAPFMKTLGWSSDFQIQRIAAWAQQHSHIQFDSVIPLFPAGFFKLITLTRSSG